MMCEDVPECCIARLYFCCNQNRLCEEPEGRRGNPGFCCCNEKFENITNVRLDCHVRLRLPRKDGVGVLYCQVEDYIARLCFLRKDGSKHCIARRGFTFTKGIVIKDYG